MHWVTCSRSGEETFWIFCTVKNPRFDFPWFNFCCYYCYCCWYCLFHSFLFARFRYFGNTPIIGMVCGPARVSKTDLRKLQWTPRRVLIKKNFSVHIFPTCSPAVRFPLQDYWLYPRPKKIEKFNVSSLNISDFYRDSWR